MLTLPAKLSTYQASTDEIVDFRTRVPVSDNERKNYTPFGEWFCRTVEDMVKKGSPYNLAPQFLAEWLYSEGRGSASA